MTKKIDKLYPGVYRVTATNFAPLRVGRELELANENGRLKGVFRKPDGVAELVLENLEHDAKEAGTFTTTLNGDRFTVRLLVEVDAAGNDQGRIVLGTHPRGTKPDEDTDVWVAEEGGDFLR